MEEEEKVSALFCSNSWISMGDFGGTWTIVADAVFSLQLDRYV